MSVAVPVRFRPEHADGFRQLVSRLLEEFDHPVSDDIDRELSDPDGTLDAIWVVPEADELIGCCAMRATDRDTVELRRMYVEPAFRGRNLGQLLVDAALAWAKEQGYQRVVLNSGYALADAVGLYESVGFAPTGRDGRYELSLEPGA